MQALKALIKSEDYELAWQRLMTLADSVGDYPSLTGLCRLRKKLGKISQRPGLRRVVRLAVLGGASTELLEGPLQLFIESQGLDAIVQCSEYNTFVQEILDPASDTVSFKPDVALLMTTAANIPRWPGLGDDLDGVNRTAVDVSDYWLDLCERLHKQTNCEVILDNFHAIPTRPLGNLAVKTPSEPNNFLARVNLRLGENAPAYVHVNDVAQLACQYGVRNWFDARFWFHAKQPVSFSCLIPYVRNTARMIGALLGCAAKCLVLDLDNTLWGGVVGDDGVEGIRIGDGDAVGEAFKAFQEYVLNLKQRGVMLAVCSKNDEVHALGPFQELSDMVLKRDDFVAFVANWEPKPDNIAAIAAQLNIGLNAIVFVDDNPAEREHVRQRLPEVRVVELSDDPADYPRILDDAGYFEVMSISAEDQARTRQYQQNAARVRLQESAGDYQDYLKSLDQRAVIRPFEKNHLERITQLINKSNQFNLTTLRLSRSQVEAMMTDEDYVTVCVRLADRFGDNGLISVVAGKQVDNVLHIELWLMSCRVLKRNVEMLLLNHLVDISSRRGVANIQGIYRPTPKNGLVKRLYPTLGFQEAGDMPDGAKKYSLKLDGFSPLSPPIMVVDEY